MARPKQNTAPDTTRAIELTAGAIDRLTCRTDVKAQAFLRDIKAPGLKVRVTNTGAKSFVFEAKLNRQTIRRTIGDVKVWTIEQARAEARKLAVMLDSGTDPREVDKAVQDARAAKKQAAAEAKRFSLENLLRSYVAHQKERGRVSAKDASSIFENHVIAAWPRVAALPAAEVTDEQIADMMRRLVEDGKGRTANKLRTYLAAAFQLAKSAKTDPSVPLIFKSYGIRLNPAAETMPHKESNRADKNPLSVADLRAYWQAIRGMEGLRGAVLRLHLLTGGQRIEQLVRLLAANIRADTIVLYDGKGRPGAGLREHVIPLVPAAQEALASCRPGSPFALSSDGGRTHIWNTTLGAWASDAGKGIADFEPKRIRSGIETFLASVGFSRDDRGRLQSHGLSGVQHRHYDGHDYLEVKRKQLEALFDALEGVSASNVVLLRAG